jgi:hypothetical protein
LWWIEVYLHLFKLLTGEEPAEDLEFVLINIPGDDVDELEQKGFVQFINNGDVHKGQEMPHRSFPIANYNLSPVFKFKISKSIGLKFAVFLTSF